MYLNDGNTITNTPNVSAVYNTYPFVPQPSTWYDRKPMKYVDAEGQVHQAYQLGNACYQILPGGMYKGTPTRTGSWYQLNYQQVPCERCFQQN